MKILSPNKKKYLYSLANGKWTLFVICSWLCVFLLFWPIIFLCMNWLRREGQLWGACLNIIHEPVVFCHAYWVEQLFLHILLMHFASIQWFINLKLPWDPKIPKGEVKAKADGKPLLFPGPQLRGNRQRCLTLLKVSPLFSRDWYTSSFLPFDMQQHRVEKVYFVNGNTKSNTMACYAYFIDLSWLLWNIYLLAFTGYGPIV